MVNTRAEQPSWEAAPDGSPVELYARMPTFGKPEMVHAQVAEGASVLAGNLVNTDDDTLRQHLLSACARHLAPGGVVLVQWRPPDWFAAGRGLRQLGVIEVSRIETDLGKLRISQWLSPDRLWFSAPALSG